MKEKTAAVLDFVLNFTAENLGFVAIWAVSVAILLTLVLVIRRRLRNTCPEKIDADEASTEPRVSNSEAPPAFKSQLMSGAIADRFKIPGVGEQTATAPKASEPTSQAAHVKTKLKIH